MVQTLNGHAAVPAFTNPIQASQHFNHRGSMNTLMAYNMPSAMFIMTPPRTGSQRLGEFTREVYSKTIDAERRDSWQKVVADQQRRL